MKTRLILSITLLLLVFGGCNKNEPYEDNLLTKDDLSGKEYLQKVLTDYHYQGDLTLLNKKAKTEDGYLVKNIEFKRAVGIMIMPGTEPSDRIEGCFRYVEGYGIASLIGKFTVENVFCFEEWPNVYGFITAANGDEIHTQLIDMVIDAAGNGDAIYIVLGGTGRFEETIGGELHLYGTFDFSNMTWNLKGEGNLIFDK
ncbi:MAG: hypothetical protein ABFR62_10920 [Bacteroidota bacterium]